MKKTILLSGILLFSVSITFAQFAEKGSMLFNGSIGYYSGKYKTESASFTSEYTQTLLTASPMFQYFVINNLSVGALLNLEQDIEKYDNGDKYSNTRLIFAPVVRYYIWQALFAQAHFGFGTNKNKTETGNGSSETSSPVTQWAVVAGYSVRITDTVLFDPMLGFRSYKLKVDGDGDNTQTWGAVCIQLGFTILINK